MTWKLIGAVLVFTGCGGFGFSMAAFHRREEAALRQLLIALEFMECDLSCRLTPLPQLCRDTAQAVTGPIHSFLMLLSQQLELYQEPDVSACTRSAMLQTGGLSPELETLILELGSTLGRFDLPGQLRQLRSCSLRAKQALQSLEENRTGRLRSYQTLGLCTGAALAILFL